MYGDSSFLKEIIIFPAFSDPEQKLFGFLSKSVPRGCQNRNQLVRKKIFSKIVFLKKNLYFLAVSDIEQKIFGVWSKNFPRGSQNCIQRVQKNSFSWDISSEKSVLISSFSDRKRKKYRRLVRTYSAWLSKLHSTCPQGHFSAEMDVLKFLNSFPDIERKVFGLLWNSFQPGCQNCILLVQKKFFERYFFWKKSIVFIIIGHWSKNIPLLVKKIFSAECRNCILRAHQNVFQRDSSFEKI